MSVKKNFFYNIIYQLLIFVIPIFTTPYVSRVLGADGLGRFSYAYSIMYYFLLLEMLGVNNYGSRTIAAIRDDLQKKSRVFWEIYLFQIIMSIFIIIIYIISTMLFFSDKKMAWIMVLYLVGAGLDINWFFFGLEKFKITITRNIIIKILTVIAIFAFIKGRDDVIKYAFIYAFGMLLSQIILWIQMPKEIKLCRFDINGIIRHIKPNIVLFIPVIAISVYKTMDKIMLGYIATTTEVGYYEACEKILSIPNAFVTALGTVVMPRIAHLVSNKGENESLRYINKSIIFSSICTSSMCFGIIAISSEFVPLFYGSGFEKCIVLFKVLLPSTIFVGIANVMRTQYLIPLKKDLIYVKSVFLGATINMLINLLLIPKYASVGAAIGTFAAEMCVCVYQLIIICMQVDILKSLRNSLYFVIIGIIMLLVVKPISIFQTQLYNMLFKIIIGIIVYAIGVLLFLWVAHNKISNEE